MLTIPPSPRDPSDAAAGTRRLARPGWATALRWLAAALLFLCSLVIAAWLILQWGILPRIEHWRPMLQARAGEALGVPVRIGVIGVTQDAGVLRWTRAIELGDVVLYEPTGAGSVVREALRLPRVRVSLSPTSLLPGWDGRWRLRFTQLLIENARLEVRRDAQGRIRLAGLPSGDEGGAHGRAEDWFFSQPDFILRGATVTWADERRAAAPIVLSDVEFTVRNGVRRHVLALSATPPPEIGSRFALQGDFTRRLLAGAGGGDGESHRVLTRPGDWRRWRGSLQVDLPRVELASLGRHVDLPLGLERGSGAASAELDVQEARVLGGHAELDMQDLSLRLEPQAPPLSFARMAGRLSGRRDASADGRPAGGELAAERFGFTTADGLTWPAGTARARWRRAPDGALAGGELQAEHVDLALLHATLARLPDHWLADATRERLRSLDPRGVASDVQARWEGDTHAPSSYRLQARLSGLQLAAEALAEPAASAPGSVMRGRPGVYGADVDLLATEAGGNARITLNGGALAFPGVFAQPRIELDELGADLAWRIDAARDGGAPQIEVQARDVRFANADAQGRFDLAWSSGETQTAPAAAGPRASDAAETGTRASGPAPAGAAPAADAASGLAHALRERLPGTLDLRGTLSRARATSVARYLPLDIPAPVRRYVEQAVLGGAATAVDFRVRGDLRHFPFAADEAGKAERGEFRVAARLAGVRFAYLPPDAADAPRARGASSAGARPWPAFDDVQGELVFERRSIVLNGLQGRLASVGSGGLKASGVHGGIADWDHRAALRIEGQAQGPLADALAFTASTPVGSWLGDALAQAGAAGPKQAPLSLQLSLEIPLHDDAAQRSPGTERSADAADDAPARVRGELVLAGNDLRLRPDVPVLADAKARIAFTESGFSLDAGRAGLLGGQSTVQAATQADGALRFDVQGTVAADALARATEWGALAAAAAPLSGQATYRLVLGIRNGRSEWRLDSDLLGLGVDLPAPLGKRAGDVLPLRVQAGAPIGVVPGAVPAGAAPRDLLRAELGPENARVLQARWLREHGPAGTRVLNGGIGVFDAPPQPADGVAASIKLPRLDVDAWQRVAQRWDDVPRPGARPALGPNAGADPDAAVAGPSRVAGTDPASGAALPAGYVPDTLALQVQALQVGGRPFNGVVAGVSQGRGAEASLWRINVDARELHGYAEYHPAGVRGAEGAGLVLARLTRLALPQGEADAVGSLLEEAAPTRLPALDVVIDDLELRGKRLGRFEIVANNRQLAGGAAGWQLERLGLTMPEARLSGRGEWIAPASPGARRRAVLDFELEVKDGGELLARLGQPGVLRGARGTLGGQVSWLGSPLAIDYPSLAGRMHLAFDRGQFLQAEPGIAKLLGVLSLQALPRRLLLDFRDVFEQGFAFDSLNGDASIDEGVASTRNLRMRGVQAVVLMEGSADIERETQDLRVWVVPEINAGTASLAVAVINPAAGLGAFLAQWLLRRPLALAGMREFHVTGPWADPRVERIERGEGGMPAALDAPASAPAPAIQAPGPGQ
jgi:uncharacterized protein (TIGR02099 family)